MIVFDRQDPDAPSILIGFLKNQSVWLAQIHCVLPFHGSLQPVASANPVQDHFLNGIRRLDLPESGVELDRHPISMGLDRFGVLGAHLLHHVVLVGYLQVITSQFTSKVNPL